ncbi:hypothetical protein BGZ65_002804 [Modicella reniformis]|uniref:Uncharacterized protein n=1 Tax=Modicella reniformis TaxID=1440133 RepID=A0A9P6ILB8_9FUNG|nr:hypothetical protein BGZ65_002804 [Modicella reniformis]
MYNQHQDGLDEVGFGAHIDKSVAAAGDRVSLDMFVVKSDLMKVAAIKVSLVETTQVFSFLNYGSTKDLVEQITTMTKKPKRRLVNTHVVKIAKDYALVQSEESHTNDNHLKGYYEDFRTAKSLSVYKLIMQILEKRFDNRSNSDHSVPVQSALPPVPVLVTQSEEDSLSNMSAFEDHDRGQLPPSLSSERGGGRNNSSGNGVDEQSMNNIKVPGQDSESTTLAMSFVSDISLGPSISKFNRIKDVVDLSQQQHKQQQQCASTLSILSSLRR